jgi:hypothetical protein
VIDYLDIPLGGSSPDRVAEFDPEGGAPPASLEEVARQIHATSLKNARLLGSEPLTHPRLDEIIGLLRVHNFQRLRVQTGGWPLRDRERRDQLFKMGVRLFEVRFLSSRRGEHDRLAGRRGSFAAAWAALKHVKLAGEELLGGGPTFLEVRLVVTPENLATLERTLAEASRWPVHQLAVVPGRQPFSLAQAGEAIRKGIEHALTNKCWVYLEGWPACLFPNLELHLRELTRKVEGHKSFSPACESCPYLNFCGGVPPWFHPGQEPVVRPVLSGHDWGKFHARVILGGI